MSRTISESINQLQTSLSDIKTSLSAKNVEGGEQIKVSQVAGLIDQIQAGGGGLGKLDPSIFTSVKLDGNPVKFCEVVNNSNLEASLEIEINYKKTNFIVNCYHGSKYISIPISDSKGTISNFELFGGIELYPVVLLLNWESPEDNVYGFLFFIMETYYA